MHFVAMATNLLVSRQSRNVHFHNHIEI